MAPTAAAAAAAPPRAAASLAASGGEAAAAAPASAGAAAAALVAAAPTTTTPDDDDTFRPLPEKFNVWNAVGTCLQPVLRAGVRLLPAPLKFGAEPRPRLPSPVPPAGPIPETPRDKLDAELARLSRAATTWRTLTAVQRAALMDACLRAFVARMPALARATAELRGTGDQGLGEDYASLVPVVMALVDLRASLRAEGKPRPLALWKRRLSAAEVEQEQKEAAAAAGEGGSNPPRATEQWVAKVFPVGMTAIMYPGFSGEVWMMPGAVPTQGRTYREKRQAAQSARASASAEGSNGGAALVLGAGNQLAVAVMDVLHKLVVDDETVLLKFNPVNERAGPLVELALAPLSAFVGYAYGGAAVGAHLTRHALVRSIHLTGSVQTYNAIAWGDPRGPSAPASSPPADSPLARGVPVGAELGNVTPYVIVPGDGWTEEDLLRHADSVVSGLVNNCGHNCLAAEVVVTDARWPLRQRFLELVRERLDRCWRRAPYYPGSEAKLRAFRAAFPDAEELGRRPGFSADDQAGAGGGGGNGGGAPPPEPVPWLLKAGLTADQARVQEETWCGVVQEVALTYDDQEEGGNDPSSPNVPAFLRAAASFCNDQCWGTLAASVFIPPTTQAQFPRDVDTFLGALRYGSVSVNCPALGAFAVASLGWGAFAARGAPQSIGTGNCVVHNTFLFDAPQKSVFRAPWRTAPAQLWSVSQANLEGAVPAAARFLDAQGDGRPVSALAWVTLAAWRAVRGTVGRAC